MSCNISNCEKEIHDNGRVYINDRRIKPQLCKFHWDQLRQADVTVINILDESCLKENVREILINSGTQTSNLSRFTKNMISLEQLQSTNEEIVLSSTELHEKDRKDLIDFLRNPLPDMSGKKRKGAIPEGFEDKFFESLSTAKNFMGDILENKESVDYPAENPTKWKKMIQEKHQTIEVCQKSYKTVTGLEPFMDKAREELSLLYKECRAEFDKEETVYKSFFE